MSINEKMIKELADMVAPKVNPHTGAAAKAAIAKEKEELKKAMEEEGGADPEGGAPGPEGGADPEGGAPGPEGGADPEPGTK